MSHHVAERAAKETNERRLPLAWVPLHISLELGEVHDLDGDEIALITEGELLVSATDEHGDEIFASVRERDAFIGLERLRKIRVSYRLQALSSASVALIHAPIMYVWTRQTDKFEPTTSIFVTAAIEAARQFVCGRVAAHDKVLTRVAKLLLETPAESALLRLRRMDMARLLSIVPETLSRMLRTLEERGAITLRPHIKVISRDKLLEVIG